MELGTVTNSISSVGFPIVCVIGLAFFIYKIWQRMSEQQEQLTVTLVAVNSTNKELSETNKKLVENISKDIEKIKEKMEDKNDGRVCI